MPELVDEAKDEVEDGWKGAVAFGAATGVGGAFGPIGEAAGAVAAGTYRGGTVGSAMTEIGGGNAIRRLIQSGMGGGSGGSRKRV